jgi:hypothetical protein
MGNKTKRTPTEKLRLIGKLQLGSYIFILVWMTFWEAVGISARGEFFTGPDGEFPWMWVPFVLLGFLLLPSAITFIQTGKRPSSRSTRSARILQTILFSIVLILTFPAFALMSQLWRQGFLPNFWAYMAFPSFFIACVLGIISFPIMWRITRSLVSKKIKVPVDENQNLIKQ